MTWSGSDSLVLPVSGRDHMRGPEEAPVTLVEYGDYECPFCRGAHVAVEKVRQRLGDRLLFVFRNFPLENVHPHARAAAQAAEAAGGQGKFWEYHDLLFEHQRHLQIGDLERYAAQIGLDIQRFSQEIHTGEHSGRVEEDLKGALDNGLTGTPVFFINGMLHRGSYHPNELLATIEDTSGEK
jgi:protein-disulfide isomerase